MNAHVALVHVAALGLEDELDGILDDDDVVVTLLIDDVDDIQLEWLNQKSAIGVTAGASAPELLVQNVIEYLQENGVSKVSSLGFNEDVVFSLPKSLR